MSDSVVGRAKTFDDRDVVLWSDGSLTWGRLGTVINGSPHARTDVQVRDALAAGWLVLGDASLYVASEIPSLIKAARKTAAKGGGTPGMMRSSLATSERKATQWKPIWTVIQADRDGNPRVRVWKLPRLTHPRLAVWDERSPGGGRYHVVQEIGRPGSGTYGTPLVRFDDLGALSTYLDETSAMRTR